MKAKDASAPTLLIVDDVPENLDILVEVLGEEYDLTAATDGETAINIARTSPQPDLILLDVIMPGMTGLEVCQKLKSDKKTRKIPIIFVTALDEVADESKGLELGAVDYIAKPISPPILKARVKNHLNLRNAQEQLEVAIYQTLNGSIKMMMDFLAAVNPMVFSRSTRLKNIVQSMTEHLELKNAWELEIAGMLSQVGLTVLHEDLQKKACYGLELSENEEKELAKAGAMSADMLRRIPLLEVVAEMVACQQDPPKFDPDASKSTRKNRVALGAQILKASEEFDRLVTSGESQGSAIKQLQQKMDVFDPLILNALISTIEASERSISTTTVKASEAVPGMILQEDVYSDSGILLAAKGTELSEPFIAVFKRFERDKEITKPFAVAFPSV